MNEEELTRRTNSSLGAAIKEDALRRAGGVRKEMVGVQVDGERVLVHVMPRAKMQKAWVRWNPDQSETELEVKCLGTPGKTVECLEILYPTEEIGSALEEVMRQNPSDPKEVQLRTAYVSPIEPVIKAVTEGLAKEQSTLFHLLRGHRAAHPLSSPYAPLRITVLNAEQNKAYQVLRETGISIVQGFPGSGKTRMICQIVHNLLWSHPGEFRVMLVADSNGACEVLCKALIQLGLHPVWEVSKTSGYPLDSSVSPYTLGATQKMNPQYHDTKILEDVQIVVATIHMATTREGLRRRVNDLVVIDKAGIINTYRWSTLALPIAGGLLIAGDHLQQCPYGEEHGRSLFEALLKAFPANRTTLHRQYRMGPLLSMLSNAFAYDGSMRSAKDEVTLPVTLPVKLQQPIVTIDVKDGKTKKRIMSYSNEDEVKVVLHLLYLLKKSYAPSDLQVISPYNGQLTLLTTHMWQLHPDVPAPLSVRQSQGSEYPVVILTLARYKPDAESSSFTSDVRVMNVAVSRAQAQLIIIGGVQQLVQVPLWHRWDAIWQASVMSVQNIKSFVDLSKKRKAKKKRQKGKARKPYGRP